LRHLQHRMCYTAAICVSKSINVCQCHSVQQHSWQHESSSSAYLHITASTDENTTQYHPDMPFTVFPTTNYHYSRVIIINRTLTACPKCCSFLSTFDILAVCVLYNGPPFPLKIAPSDGGDLPHLTHGSLDPPSPQPKQYLNRFSRFCRPHYCDT